MDIGEVKRVVKVTPEPYPQRTDAPAPVERPAPKEPVPEVVPA